MSEILSKEQIDQLLSGSGFTDAGKKTADTGSPADESLRKIGELFCKQTSAVLTTALSRNVSATFVSCAKSTAEAVRSDFGENALCCTIPVSGGFTGSFWLLIGKKIAAIAGDLMMMQEPKGIFGAEHLDAIVELVNQLISSFSTAYTGKYGAQLQTGAAQSAEFLIDSPPCPWNGSTIITGRIAIEGSGDAPFSLLITDVLGNRLASGAKSTPAEPADGSAKTGAASEFIETRESADAPPRAMPAPKVPRAGKDNIDLLLDIDLDVSIELGNSVLSIKRILELAPGSIIELDRMAGEPVDLMVNNKVVAKGEVVVIDESFGIRILSLVSPEERIRSLR